MRHPESPVTIADLERMKQEIMEAISYKGSEYMDIRQAEEYTGRSAGTIRKHCRIAKKGFNGKHLYSVVELDLIK